MNMGEKQQKKLLDVRNIEVMRGQTVALRDFTWTVHKGEHWAVLGPNGSGKSTVVQVLQGWLWPQAGEVSVHPKRPEA